MKSEELHYSDTAVNRQCVREITFFAKLRSPSQTEPTNLKSI